MFISTKVRLAQVIQAIIKAEQLTEFQRVKLAEQPLFEPYTAFRRLDQDRRGELKLSDLIEFLDDNNIQYSQNEVAYLFKKVDLDRDGRISYNDFNKSTLPRQDARLRQLACLRDSYYIEVNMLLPNDVEFSLAKFFEQEIKNYRLDNCSINYIQRTINEVKIGLISSLDYSSLEAFRQLDLFNQGYVTKDSLVLFMRDLSIILTYDDLESFFRSVDLDEDGRISYSELVEAVHLMEPLPYDYSPIVDTSREIRRAIEHNHALERLYLSTYPYYFYPYYTSYYPYYYPYLTNAEIALRNSSLERLRIQRIGSEIKLQQMQELRRSRERDHSYERLKQIQSESLSRQLQLENQQRQWELERLRNEELRKSREKISQIENDSLVRQIELDRQLRDIERQSRLRQLDSESRLRGIERLSSLERLRHLENLRRIERDFTLSRLYDPYLSYSRVPYYEARTYQYQVLRRDYSPMKGSNINVQQVNSPQEKSQIKQDDQQMSGIKEDNPEQVDNQQEPIPMDKQQNDNQDMKKSIE